MQVNRNVRTANLIKFFFDGKEVGLAQGLNPSDDYGMEPVYEIGDIDPQELVPTAARYSMTLDKVLLNKDALTSAGIVPENGQAVLKGYEFTVEVYDENTGDLLVSYTGVKYASGSVNIRANAIVSMNAQFMARGRSGTGI